MTMRKTKTISKIEDVETPVIGAHYLVPCVNIKLNLYEKNKLDAEYMDNYFGRAFKQDRRKYEAQLPAHTRNVEHPYYINGLYLPIIGVHHEDAKELDFEFWHYHYDWRFINITQFLFIVGGSRSHQFESGYTKEQFVNPDAFGINNQFLGIVMKTECILDKTIVYQKKLMKRQMPVTPNKEFFKNKFEHNYVGKTWKCNKICPHKGTPLTGAAKDAKGRYVCPTHGLVFNQQGVCEERFSTPQAEKEYLQTIQILKDGN